MSRARRYIVAATQPFTGGTYELLHYTFPKLGRTAKFVDSQNLEGFKQGQ